MNLVDIENLHKRISVKHKRGNPKIERTSVARKLMPFVFFVRLTAFMSLPYW